MKTRLLTALLLTGCGLDFQPLKGETTAIPVKVQPQASALSAVATIENGLPYDGCSYPITIGELRYAASPATRALVQQIASRAGQTQVAITYRVTGSSTTVECGWGSTQSLPEIEVLSASVAATTGRATIGNGLPFDGCSYPITLGSARVEYAPSPASASLVAAAASQVGGNIVTIDYVLTGGTAEVACGWNTKRQLPEIDVKAIRP